jgi:hypothetical protein
LLLTRRERAIWIHQWDEPLDCSEDPDRQKRSLTYGDIELLLLCEVSQQYAELKLRQFALAANARLQRVEESKAIDDWLATRSVME